MRITLLVLFFSFFRPYPRVYECQDAMQSGVARDMVWKFGCEGRVVDGGAVKKETRRGWDVEGDGW